MRLDDRELVRREYGDERALAIRSAVFRELIEGRSAEDVALEAIAEAEHSHVLEVGCGTGELAARVARELGAVVVAVDLSPRMVELARARGVDARLGDVEALSFAEGSFDCVVASWMLYHLSDLDLGLSEIARVLRPGGRLVASTFGRENLRDLWQFLGESEPPEHPFSRENGEEILSRRFSRVERIDVDATVVFPHHEAVRRYVAASIRRSHLAERVPAFEGPFRARSVQTVFVAEP